MKLLYTPDAEEDIVSIYAYLATKADQATADRTNDQIIQACERLIDFPNSGRRRAELDMHGLEIQSLVVGRYTAYYTQANGDVYIVRVLHQTRDVGPAQFDGLEAISGL